MDAQRPLDVSGHIDEEETEVKEESEEEVETIPEPPPAKPAARRRYESPEDEEPKEKTKAKREKKTKKDKEPKTKRQRSPSPAGVPPIYAQLRIDCQKKEFAFDLRCSWSDPVVGVQFPMTKRCWFLLEWVHVAHMGG